MRRLEKAARDGFIKNFDHRQMGSRMEALVYSGTRDKKERENEEEKERNARNERARDSERNRDV